MAERYIRVFTQQGQFYCPGSPVVIEAGALLKDNQTGKIIAQMKFKNISPKTIRALTVKIYAKDVSGVDIEGIDSFQYLDLNVSRDGEFGAKTPIVLPNAVTRTFICECLSVVFCDGSAWACKDGTQWDVLPAPILLKSEIGVDLAEQYQRDTSAKMKYKIADHKDIWYCSCGAINHTEEDFCHSCRTKKATLVTALNLNTLRENKEKHDDAVATKLKEENEQAQKRKNAINKRIIVVTAIIALFICIWGTVSIYNNLPSTKYKHAVSMMQEGQYVSAQEAFGEIKDYRDSALLLRECEWREGLALYLEGKYDEANEIFSALTIAGDIQPDYITDAINNYWLEVAQKYIANRLYYEAIEAASNAIGTEVMDAVKESIYQRGLSFCEQEEYFHPIRIFELLGDYKDSPDLLQFARNESEYQNALSLFNEGRYDEAKDSFVKIIDYKDCLQYLEENYEYKLLGENLDRFEYNEKTKNTTLEYQGQTTYIFDANGMIIEDCIKGSAQKHLYTYENGVLVEESYDYGNGCYIVFRYTYSYDTSGALIQKQRVVADAKSASSWEYLWEYTYDKEGRILTKTRAYGNFDDYQIYDFRWNYQYDVDGRIDCITIDTFMVDGSIGKENAYTIKCIYDENGRLIKEVNTPGTSNFDYQDPMQTKWYTYDRAGNVVCIEHRLIDNKTGTEYTERIIRYVYDWVYIGEN